MSMTRILFASDFHGSEACFRKFISAASHYEADVLIAGGDVTGKAMVPIVHQGNGRYRGTLFGRKEEPATQEELANFKRVISNTGFYPIVLEPDEASALEADKDLLEMRFEAEMVNRVRDWLTWAESKLFASRIPLYFMPGNDDLYSIDAVIAEFDQVHNPDGKRYWIDDDHELVGISNANMTPWKCARDVEEDVLEKRLEELAALLEYPPRAVVDLHVPPYKSGLDVCPELDENLKVKTLGGQVLMKPVGSTAVRKFIEKMQPLLSLHGHIHESPGYTRIGRTLSINAGSEYAEGILRAAIINLERDKVKGYILVSG
jgi:Icc-related predicted phosphoesterase